MQVFTCEQLLYSKNQLERHMRAGDLTGALRRPPYMQHNFEIKCLLFDFEALWPIPA